MQHYLIEVVVDCNDDDLISDTYIGDIKDVAEAQWAVRELQTFYLAYKNIHADNPRLKHSAMLADLMMSISLLTGSHINTMLSRDFLCFVKQSLDRANRLADWANYHWPDTGLGGSLCHTLKSVKIYELKTDVPIVFKP